MMIIFLILIAARGTAGIWMVQLHSKRTSSLGYRCMKCLIPENPVMFRLKVYIYICLSKVQKKQRFTPVFENTVVVEIIIPFAKIVSII